MTLMDSYFPMAIGPGANSGMDRWRIMGRRWHPTGAILGVTSELSPSYNAGTSQLIIGPGAAWIEGFYAERSGSASFTAVVGPGICVLRLDPAANEVRVVWRAGVTAPDQSPSGIYEMPICSLSAANVMTDLRPVVGGSGGRAAGARGPVTQVDCGASAVTLVTMTLRAQAGRRYEISAFARGFGANLSTNGLAAFEVSSAAFGGQRIGNDNTLGNNVWISGSMAGVDFVPTASGPMVFTLTGSNGAGGGVLRVPAQACFLMAKDIGAG